MISFIVLTCSSKHTRAAERRRRRWSGCWTVWRSLTLSRGEEVQRSAAVWGGPALWTCIGRGSVVTWLETFKLATFTFRMNTPPPSTQKKKQLQYSHGRHLTRDCYRKKLATSTFRKNTPPPSSHKKNNCNNPLAKNSRYKKKTHTQRK